MLKISLLFKYKLYGYSKVITQARIPMIKNPRFSGYDFYII